MPEWYITIFICSILYFGVSTICFRSLTAKRINQALAAKGEFYLSTKDKVGYSLFDVALSIILPIKVAKKIVPKLIIDAESVNDLKISKSDVILSYCFITSSILFLATGLVGVRFT